MRIERLTGKGEDPNASSSQRSPFALPLNGKAPGAISFTAVNGWRGPGAIAIAIGHFGAITDFFPAKAFLPVTLMVDLFFVLSGLVIAYAYSTKLAKASNIPEYVVRRFGRIWPVQAATLLILVGYELAKLLLSILGYNHFTTPAFSKNGMNLLDAIPTNLLFLHSLGLHDRETWNYPSWSLSVEFATYVAFAGFCLATPKLRRVLSVLTIFASLAVLSFVAPNGMRSTYDFGIFRCLAGFFTGTLCFEVAVHARIPSSRFPTLIEGIALALVTVWLASALQGWSGYAAPLVFALFVLVFLSQNGLISRVLETRFFQTLSDLSFTIYMVHALVLIAFLATMHAIARHTQAPLFCFIPDPIAFDLNAAPQIEVLHLESTFSEYAIFAAYLAVVFVASYTVYRLVEIPGRRYFSMVAKRLAAPSLAGHRDGFRAKGSAR